MGLRDPICDSGLDGWIWLKKGIYLRRNQLEILHTQMETILQHSFYENSQSKKQVLDFINHVLSNEEQRKFLAEKMKEYNSMTFKNKIKLINHLLVEMFQQRQMNRDDDNYGLKTYLDNLSSKINLIFSIFSFNLDNVVE